MNIREAYQTAYDLEKEGYNGGQIANELFKRGYVSVRTGKKITPSGALQMVYKVRDGRLPTSNRKSAKIHATASTKKYPKYFHRPSQGKSVWDILQTIHESNVFSETTRKALMEIIIREAFEL